MAGKNLKYADRIAICKACQYYNSIVGTCGTPGVGHTVRHNGQEVKLCGCIIALKAAMPMLSCPIDKWTGHITESERLELLELLKDYHQTKTIKPKLLIAWYNKAFPGANRQYSECPPCIASMVDQLWMKVKDRPVKVDTGQN